jgi:thiol-disulfide isomerase/thioredoxin
MYSEGVKPGVFVLAMRWLVVLLVAIASVVLVAGRAAAEDDIWHHTDDDGATIIDLYFVYSSTCPHCQRALPFIDDLEQSLPWLNVVWLKVDSDDPEIERVALAAADEVGQTLSGVPAFMFCNTMITGYDGPEGIGAVISSELGTCHRSYSIQDSSTSSTTTPRHEVTVPGIGTVATSSVPLPVFTAIVAGLDAFNPCAFFVLLFLLSLLVHTRDRTRMAVVGFTFVAISGILYFAFMAAWLNVFLVTGHLKWITATAGVIAITIALLNLKDYARPGSKGSLSIPESAKPGLFARMRGLVGDDRFVPVLGATVALAVVANSYELLCTAGLPMVFTRVLTMHDLSTPEYYGYLAFYNMIYVLPLFGIVIAFVSTLGSRKLQPEEGRVLKLLSGTMMLGLGAVLLLAPELLEQIGVAVGILAVAVVVTIIVILVDRLIHRSVPTARGM